VYRRGIVPAAIYESFFMAHQWSLSRARDRRIEGRSGSAAQVWRPLHHRLSEHCSGTWKQGDTDAQTIVENCGNTVIFRCSASERGGTAEFASRLIGKREIIRQHTSRSRPTRLGGSVHETQTTSDHRTLEDAVMASEIEQLPDLAGFLKIASQPHWRCVQIAHPASSRSVL